MQADWFCLDCRVGMKWTDRMFWKCPECGTEVWPEEPEAIERGKKQAAADNPGADNSGMVSRAWIPGTEAKGGGGATGKSRKKPLRKSDFRHRMPLDTD